MKIENSFSSFCWFRFEGFRIIYMKTNPRFEVKESERSVSGDQGLFLGILVISAIVKVCQRWYGRWFGW